MKVKGRIIRRFTLENEKYAKAIEMTAGGKMFQVIVDNADTATLLLARRCFDFGVVMIPLNKIQPKLIPKEKLEKIYKISNGDAKLAVDVIKFDEELRPAMEFVFGSTIICSTTEIATKLAYSKDIAVKCVNLDGDVFDPTGVLTGGFQKQGDSIISKVVELNDYQNKLKEVKEDKTKKLLDIMLTNPLQNPPPYEKLIGDLDSFRSGSKESEF